MFDTPDSSSQTSSTEYLARRARTLGDLFLQRVDRDAHRVAIKQRRDGRWLGVTWKQVYDRAAAIAAYLVDHGVAPGDKVCIVGSTGPAWSYADLGGHLAGAVTLGAYPTLPAAQLAYILDHSDTKIAFVEGAAEIDKIIEMRDRLPRLERVCVWSPEGVEQVIAEHDWLVSWHDVLAHTGERSRIDERVAAVDPDSTAIIIYTSGTTGPPKGAMISHRNILALLRDLEAGVPVVEDDISFSFLPMAHAAERVVGFYSRINGGVATYFASSVARVLEELQEVKPTLFGSVPRVFEKAYDRIMAGVQSAPPARRAVFRWAERVGRRAVAMWQEGRPIPRTVRLQHRLADRLVFARLRQVFGGRVRYIVTGAAPIAPEILEFFWAAGFRMFEVYGMTEATAVTHINRPGAVRLGSVGQALPWAEVRLADDGEILVRGECVFQGYYKDPDATAAAIDGDGWLHTGDIGVIDDDGYLYIRDRKKHIIITAGGKNITPANIENELKAADPLISQVHVHGDKRPYLTALITLGAAEAVAFARERDLVSADQAERILTELSHDPFARPEGLGDLMGQVTGHPDVRRRVADAVRRTNRELARVETIKRVYLLDRELSVAEDELTPTLKVKRKNIETKFADVFERLYSDPSSGIDTSV